MPRIRNWFHRLGLNEWYVNQTADWFDSSTNEHLKEIILREKLPLLCFFVRFRYELSRIATTHALYKKVVRRCGFFLWIRENVVLDTAGKLVEPTDEFLAEFEVRADELLDEDDSDSEDESGDTTQGLAEDIMAGIFAESFNQPIPPESPFDDIEEYSDFVWADQALCLCTDGTTEKCSICLGELQTGEGLRLLKCNHKGHQNCFDEWLHLWRSCPVCRLRVGPPRVSNDNSRESNNLHGVEVDKQELFLICNLLTLSFPGPQR